LKSVAELNSKSDSDQNCVATAGSVKKSLGETKDRLVAENSSLDSNSNSNLDRTSMVDLLVNWRKVTRDDSREYCVGLD
jgi:hypothetical protein